GLCDDYMPTAGEWAGAVLGGIGEGLYNRFVDPFVAVGDYYRAFREAGLSPAAAAAQAANMGLGKGIGYSTFLEGWVGVDVRQQRQIAGSERTIRVAVGGTQMVLSSVVLAQGLHAAGGAPGATEGSGTTYEQLVSNAKRAYPKKAGIKENHHINPKYLGGSPKGPTVPLDAAYHQQITNAFQRTYGYRQS
ncbi:MAG: hypothetical protein ACYTAS_17490, partial [Planctomycetota bacterium]